MKKIIRILTLSVLILVFVYTQSVYTHATKASAQQVLNPRSSHTASSAQHTIGESGWGIECIHCPKEFAGMTDRSLRLDSDGHPRIAYAGDRAYYAWYDGADWFLEIVDDTTVTGGYASLALDSAGNPHVSYQDANTGQLKYANKDKSGWHSQTVKNISNVGAYITLALDKNDFPHFSYYDTVARELVYLYQDDSGWHPTIVDSSDGASSLVLDQDGFPHISYLGISSVKYAYQDSGGWQIQVVENGYDCGYSGYTSLALDGSGNPHLTFSRCTYEAKHWEYLPVYTSLDKSGWNIQLLEDGYDDGGVPTSLVVDDNGYAHVAYGNQRLAYQDPSGWNYKTLEVTYTLASSLTLDDSGKAHIAYITSKDTLRTLKYAAPYSSGWEIQVVDSVQSAAGSSMKLDGSDHAHISYRITFEGPDRELVYAKRDALGWNFETVDSGDYVGSDISLDLDGDGQPHLSYTIFNNDQLRYASLEAAGWNSQTVDTQYTIGGSSLALNAQGYAHITYAPAGLKYAYQNADGWNYATPDSEGRSSALALDQNGRPHISYTNFNSNELRYTFLNGEEWQTQVLDSGGTWFGGISITLDENGHPHISYAKYFIYEHDLKYAHWDGSAWQVDTLDDNLASWQGTSLVLDGSGNAHIGYTIEDEQGYNRLKYTYKDASGWHFRTILDDKSGVLESLCLDQEGYPHMSFTEGNKLKYAYHPAPFYELAYEPYELRGYALPGITLSYTLSLTNTGQVTDTFTLSLSGNTWQTTAPNSVGPLMAGENVVINIHATIPPTAKLGSSDTATITLTSQSDPSVTATASLTTYAAVTTYLPLVER